MAADLFRGIHHVHSVCGQIIGPGSYGPVSRRRCLIQWHGVLLFLPPLLWLPWGTDALGVVEGELQRLATTDVLTQSSNRRHFFECARIEFERARQFASSLAFLLLDIDDFKRINDTHGHQMGDQVLQKVARCGAAVLRQSDLFGRIGGEEFAAVLPGCQPDLAEQIAERLQREIERVVFTAENGERFRVTASLGLARAHLGPGPKSTYHGV